MNIHEVLSPTAIALAKTLGYGVFAIAAVVIFIAGLRAYGEGRALHNRFK